MRAKRKPILISLAALAVLVAGIILLWPRPPKLPPQSITMPSGLVYTYAGTTYGTNHVFGSVSARLIQHLPTSVANVLRKILGPELATVKGSFTTPQPALFVWFDVNASNTAGRASGSLRTVPSAKIADENGFDSGVRVSVGYPGGGIAPVGEFPLLPRRSRNLELQFYQSDSGDDATLSRIGIVKLPNPVFGKYPEWKPDTGPHVRKVDDLEVRLNSFHLYGGRVTGSTWSGGALQEEGYGRRPQPGASVETVFDFEFISATGNRDRTWQLNAASISDATGNIIGEPSLISYGYAGVPNPSFNGLSNPKFMRGSLWPDEAAWKLRLEFKHTPTPGAADRVDFKKVPVPGPGTTNRPYLRIRAGDVELVLTEFARNILTINSGRRSSGIGPPGAPPSELSIRVETPGHTQGVAVDLTGVTTDAGEQPQTTMNQWLPGVRIIGLTSISTNARTVDITLSVQKTRAVEFLLKPPL